MSNSANNPNSFGSSPTSPFSPDNASFGMPGGQYGGPPEPPKKRFGWGSCLLGCLVLCVTSFAVCAGVSYYLVRRAPDIASSFVKNLVAESQMTPEDKAIVTAQIDRIHDEYKAGRITNEQVGKIFQNLVESPLFALVMVFAAEEKYVKPSGLSDAEKEQAKLVFQRVARGVVEKKIAQAKLQSLMESISVKQPNGQTKVRENLTDPELKAFIAECKQAADDANISDEPYEVKIGEEFKKAIDEALSSPTTKLPAEVSEPEIDLDGK